MRIGDLVKRTSSLVRDNLGSGIVINVDEAGEHNMPFYQVMWSSAVGDGEGLYWYGREELELVSEAR